MTREKIQGPNTIIELTPPSSERYSISIIPDFRDLNFLNKQQDRYPFVILRYDLVLNLAHNSVNSEVAFQATF